MPFDGTYFPAPTPYDTGLFPIWSRHGCRLWFETRLRRKKKCRADAVRAPTPATATLPSPGLLRDAKGMIADPKNWTRRTYRSFGGQRCAVGALRAAAKRLDDPAIAWSAHALLINVARSRGFTNVETMNDRSSHAAVMAAFDQAIRTAERTAASDKRRLLAVIRSSGRHGELVGRVPDRVGDGCREACRSRKGARALGYGRVAFGPARGLPYQ